MPIISRGSSFAWRGAKLWREVANAQVVKEEAEKKVSEYWKLWENFVILQHLKQ